MRPFSAIATMTRPIDASPSDTRSPTCGEAMNSAMVESCVEPAIKAIANTIMIIAGSASEAIMTSRLDPMPPKLVPTSMPASARKKRALPRSAMMAMRSADQENISPVRKVGTSAAATQVAAKIRYGTARNSQDALSASTTSLRISRTRSR